MNIFLKTKCCVLEPHPLPSEHYSCRQKWLTLHTVLLNVQMWVSSRGTGRRFWSWRTAAAEVHLALRPYSSTPAALALQTMVLLTDSTPASMRLSLILICGALLVGVCAAKSDSPRGVSVPFIFDPKATCDPPCRHAGICIRNNTCFCSKGYEGGVCQYGEVY